MRVSYSLLLFVALLFGCGRLVLAQSKAIQETTSSTAASLSTREPGSVPTSGSDSTATKEISKADRESAKRSYKAGISYKRGGLVRQAMQSFQQAIDSDPEFADAYSALGQTCFDLGSYQEAVVALEKAVKLNPKATDAYTLLGQAYAKSKEKGSVQEKPIDLNATESTLVSTKPDSNDDDKRVPEIDLTKVYYVGLSDVLDIRLPGRAPEESTLFVVAGNGYIDHPILGRPIKVLGLTTEQIVALFSAELKRLSIGNQIAPEVSVRDFNSHTIMVSGLVKEPGTKILRREAIPLYVVLADAQLASEAAIVDVMSQGNVKHRKIELSQPDQTAVLVRPGDVVTVRAATKQFFYVGGNVKAPGELPYRSGLTLTQAILSAGGVSIKGEKVQLTRGQGNGLLTLQEFKLKEINSGKTPDPLIEPGDRITVLP